MPENKRLVICCDGTWNSADDGGAETNVARIARAIRAGSGDKQQITLYLRGVGSTGVRLQKLVGGAFGDGVDENIRSAYMFLAQNYVPAEPGREADEIFLFGFSRGAFTARSLAGFIGACGLLKRPYLDRVDEAWTYYRKGPAPRRPEGLAEHLRAQALAAGAHPDSARIEWHEALSIRFLGVWDTVGALGVPSSGLVGALGEPYQFHDTTPSRLVRTARHALALDERRDEFVPTFWTGEAPPGSDIRQCWFAGVHADVGGGYPQRGLADIPLHWMAGEAMAAGLQLDLACLPAAAALDPLAPQHESRTGIWLKDFATPTIRMVKGHAAEVGLFAGLYQPLDARRNPLVPIGEEIHASVAARRGRLVRTITDETTGEGEEGLYAPVNLPD